MQALHKAYLPILMHGKRQSYEGFVTVISWKRVLYLNEPYKAQNTERNGISRDVMIISTTWDVCFEVDFNLLAINSTSNISHAVNGISARIKNPFIKPVKDIKNNRSME